MALLATAGVSRHPAQAQCDFEWLTGDGIPGVVGDATVFASTKWDPDGAGPETPVVVFGGTILGAGTIPVTALAAWDGESWSALGDGLPAQVRALTVYNGELIAAAGNNSFGGTGPANGVARFNGTNWEALSSAGFQNAVRSLGVYNGELYAGGLFSSAGGTPVNNIARWNGTIWQPLGVGIQGGVNAMLVHNGELIVAGVISSAGGAPATNVVRWNGTSFQTMGAIPGSVNALTFYNGEVHAAGSRVYRWDGTAWQQLGGAANSSINTLAEFNGELIAGGTFTEIDNVGVFRMARWNGAFWSQMPSGPGMPVRRCDTLLVHNGDLYAGGAGTKPSGTQTERVGRWDGAEWHYMGRGFDAIVYDMATYDGELIAGGWFYQAGDIVANGIARQDSTGQWHSMGGVSGFDGFVYDLITYDDVLIASGSFSAIDGVPTSNGMAQWDGVSWRQFGSEDVGIGKKIVHDGELYAPGGFGPNQKVARWDSVAEAWEPIGTFPTNAGATCLTFFNGDLMAGGIGGTGVDASVWRWDFDNPGTWAPVGQHLGYELLQTMAVYNGELYAGGYISHGLVRFNGTSWEPMPGGIYLGNESPDELLAVFDLRVFDGELVVAGTFSYVNAHQYDPETVPAFHMARWDGTNWHALGSGTNDAAVTLHEHDGDLYVGGWFTMAGGRPAGNFARWGSACLRGDTNCDGAINFFDIDPFLLALFDPPGYAAAFPGCSVSTADVNTDGGVNFFDIDPFLACLFSVCP